MPNEYLQKLSMSQYPYIETETPADRSAAPAPGGSCAHQQIKRRASTLHKGRTAGAPRPAPALQQRSGSGCAVCEPQTSCGTSRCRWGTAAVLQGESLPRVYRTVTHGSYQIQILVETQGFTQNLWFNSSLNKAIAPHHLC